MKLHTTILLGGCYMLQTPGSLQRDPASHHLIYTGTEYMSKEHDELRMEQPKAEMT